MNHTEKIITVGELYAALEARMPRELSCEWDHDGLSVCPDQNAPVTGVLISLDPTEDAIAAASKRLSEFSDRVTFVRNNFSNLEEICKELEIDAIDGFLIDAGVSSFQLDCAERGFS